MTHWAMEWLKSAPKVAPDNAPCIFGCSEGAVGLFELSEGCLCHPNETKQHLCMQHMLRCTPLGTYDIIHAYGEAA